MKKLLFSAVTLDVGGIETALVTLLNYLAKQKCKDDLDNVAENLQHNTVSNNMQNGGANNKQQEQNNKYEITLVLEKKQGLFLDALDSRINVIQYAPSKNKIVFFRKMINFLKQQLFKHKYGNKYDFSCSFATYSNPGAFVARTASHNSVLWCHMDYLAMFEQDQNRVKEFFEEKKYNKFKRIVFVSEESKGTFLQVFPNAKEKTVYINNLIDYNKILKLAEEKVDETTLKQLNKKEKTTTFINIGRHDEMQKKLSRIIEAAKILKSEDRKFKILFVGDGENSKYYKELVSKYHLEKEIIFLGRKKNPYPYLKMADCTISTSDYEGYPVTFVESMILNKPIITTEVSGTEDVKKHGYAVITAPDATSISSEMKKIIDNGFEIKNKFDAKLYNNEIIEKLEKLF